MVCCFFYYYYDHYFNLWFILGKKIFKNMNDKDQRETTRKSFMVPEIIVATHYHNRMLYNVNELICNTY